MDSTPLVSPLKIAIFLTGYFFLINLQSQFEVDAFTFFISYVFLLGFFIALLRYVFVCFLKLINSFRGGVKRVFWSFLSFLIPVGLSLRVVVFNFFSKSFFDL